MAKMKDYLLDQFYGNPSSVKRSYKKWEKAFPPSASQAKKNLKMADMLGEKPRKIDKKTVKQAERQEAKAKKSSAKNLKSINKKPLPARSRSGAASGRTRIGGLRGGGGLGLLGSNKIK